MNKKCCFYGILIILIYQTILIMLDDNVQFYFALDTWFSVSIVCPEIRNNKMEEYTGNLQF